MSQLLNAADKQRYADIAQQCRLLCDGKDEQTAKVLQLAAQAIDDLLSPQPKRLGAALDFSRRLGKQEPTA